MLVRQNSRSANNLIARIDVSCLAAILMMLLFVFITQVAPAHDGGVSAQLPRAKDPRLAPHARREDAITITLFRTGDIFFGNERMRTPEALHGRIRNALQSGSERTVYIRADARSKYEYVKDILDEVRVSGIEHVVFLADQRKSSAAQ